MTAKQAGAVVMAIEQLLQNEREYAEAVRHGWERTLYATADRNTQLLQKLFEALLDG